MKRISTLLSVLVTSLVLLGLMAQTVYARRYFRVDNSNYVNITQPCRDGISFDIARPDSANPILDWIKTTAGTILVPGQTLAVDSAPVQIPGGPLLPWSGQFTLAFNQTLQPGTRIYIRLTGNSENIYTTVRDCTLAAPDDDPLTAIVPDLGQSSSAGFVLAGQTVTFTVNVPLTETIGDLNLALWLEGDTEDPTPIVIDAFLQSPEGSQVQIMDNWVDNGYSFATHGFGTRCIGGSAPLIGDPKGDFNLDDESAFAYANIASEDTFGTHTAFRPHAPLSAFDGQNPTGDWLLIIENLSSVDSFLNCWYLETSAGTELNIFLPYVER